MAQKLLVLSLGTTGGEVGLAFKKQMEQRALNGFYYRVLYMDTADYLVRSGMVADSEFIHLSISNHFLRNTIASDINRNPLFRDLLYQEAPPPSPSAQGAGNVRYCAAAILSMKGMRETIKSKISTFIEQLSTQGDRRPDIAFAIVISAVGATGSGAAELLLPLVLEAADGAGIVNPKCDIIILHPTTAVDSSLLLANAEALYIEMAARHNDRIYNRYAGRRVVVGSGGQQYKISELVDMEKAAATLLRLSMDPLSGIAQQYWGSLPNRHVLRRTEKETGLPTHLSSATPITINLGDLGQQVITIDSARLASRIVLGPVKQETAQKTTNTLLLSTLNFSSFKKLLDQLTRTIRSESSALTETGMQRLKPVQQADTLEQSYRKDLERINGAAEQIQKTAAEMFRQWESALQAEGIKHIKGGNAIAQLVTHYNELLLTVRNLQSEAIRYQPNQNPTEVDLRQAFADLRNRKQRLQTVINATQQRLRNLTEESALSMATALLNELEQLCVDTISRLNTFINATEEQYANQPGWNTDTPTLRVHDDYPLSIPALTDPKDMLRYYNRVSIFGASNTTGGHTSFRSSTQKQDSQARFLEELERVAMLEHFFDGQYYLILDLLKHYVEERVQERLSNYSILDIYEDIGQAALQHSIQMALERAHPLVTLTREYATNSIGECYVSGHWRNPTQRSMLERSIKQVSQATKIFESEDPTEIVIFYFIDGLALPSINDLSGRCFAAFLEERKTWIREYRAFLKQRTVRRRQEDFSGIPVYNSNYNEQLIIQQGIVCKLYNARMGNVGEYTSADLPELACIDEEDSDFEELRPETPRARGQNGHQADSILSADMTEQSTQPRRDPSDQG